MRLYLKQLHNTITRKQKRGEIWLNKKWFKKLLKKTYLSPGAEKPENGNDDETGNGK